MDEAKEVVKKAGKAAKKSKKEAIEAKAKEEVKEEIFSGLRAQVEEARSIWHTPGHKGHLSRYDITEIDESFPFDRIARAEEGARSIYGARAIRFLTGGSSIGIKAGIMSLNCDCLIESGCHRAVRDGIKLAGRRAVIVANEVKNDLLQPLSARQIDEELSKDNRLGAVVLTSPDYYGQRAVYDEIAAVIKKHGVYLYVDAAHGAHLGFRRDLFSRPLTELADISNVSAHKTLPAFTQSAILCINNEQLIERVEENLALLGTTSPSYLLLSGIEYALRYTRENATRFDDLFRAIGRLKEDVICLKNDDFTRVVIDAFAYKMSGEELYFRLKGEGIVSEKFDERYVVLIVSIMDDVKKIAHLRERILAITRGQGERN